MNTAGRLTTHVLDTMHGCPAAGMKIELWALAGGERRLVTATTTGPEGRTERPVLAGPELQAGPYELLFYVGDYFALRAVPLPQPAFLDTVPVRFSIAEPGAHYHIPLLCSPWAYSTYRGS